MSFTRRDLLRAAAATATLGAAPRTARAAPAAAQRKFIFVFCFGGWDITKVFLPNWTLTNNPQLEDGTELTTGSATSWVSHPDRPSVDAFYQAYEHRIVRVDGIEVPSIAHDICTSLVLTGSTDASRPDVPTLLAAYDSTNRALPHLLLSGPSYSGSLSHYTARVGSNGQLQALATGEIHERNNEGVPGVIGDTSRAIVDRYLLARAEERLGLARSPTEESMVEAWQKSLERSITVRSGEVLPSTATTLWLDQADVAVQMLSLGYSRCATLMWPTEAESQWNFDTHDLNNMRQSELWEGLFYRLGELMNTLESTPGESADTLAEETVIVLWSEMSRTPFANSNNGKDHWPYTCNVVILPDGVDYSGPDVYGGFDEQLFPKPIDPVSGLADANGRTMDTESFNATLLALGDVDWEQWYPNADLLEPLTF